MSKTKRLYGEEIRQGLINGYPNIDWNLDERVIWKVMDSVVNDLASKSLLKNWKAGAPGISEGYLTTWDNVEVVDDLEDETNSYLTLPVNYADLPMERGIEQIVPIKSDCPNVVILRSRDARKLQNLMGGNMHRLSGYPEGPKFKFTTYGVKKDFGNMIVRLVIRDASLISVDAEYPIPSDAEFTMIKLCIAWFAERRGAPADKVRDKIEQP